MVDHNDVIRLTWSYARNGLRSLTPVKLRVYRSMLLGEPSTEEARAEYERFEQEYLRDFEPDERLRLVNEIMEEKIKKSSIALEEGIESVKKIRRKLIW